MTPTYNAPAICGHLFSLAAAPTPRQRAIILDELDGVSESDLSRYATAARELATTRLNPHEEKVLLNLMDRLGYLSSRLPGVIHLTQSLQHHMLTDC